jgi:hypothetical protein
MCVASTAKRRRKQLRQTKIGRNRSSSAKKKYDEAKVGTPISGKKK